MNQRTHSWIAVRAIALLDDEESEKNLVKLLKLHARKASVGAWIPDQVDAKRGGAGSSTDNHVLKMEPYTGAQRERFITTKDELLNRIGSHRMAARFLQNDSSLDDQWWATPYRGDVNKPGQHLPNRIMALGTMMKDLLLLGDQTVDQLIPGLSASCGIWTKNPAPPRRGPPCIFSCSAISLRMCACHATATGASLPLMMRDCTRNSKRMVKKGRDCF